MGVNDLVFARRVRAPASPSTTRIRTLLGALAILLSLSACGSSGSAAASAAPSVAETIDSEVEAARAVAKENPILSGVGPLESDSIGQANYWDADTTSDGYALRYSIGWGDCMAGCIQGHEFTYEVTRAGAVRLVSERGDVIPPDVVARLEERAGDGAARQGVTGRVVAGPVCPVEKPDDPACDPRPVPGAMLFLRAADGTELMRIQTDESGLFEVELPAGEYVLEAQQVQGYMGAPEPVVVVVQEGAPTSVELEYDTGIR
jgi:hypothetical protein